MKKVSLQFKSLLELTNYTIAIGVVNYEINRTLLRLSCELSAKDIEKALASFRAEIITVPEVRPSTYNPFSN